MERLRRLVWRAATLAVALAALPARAGAITQAEYESKMNAFINDAR